MKKMMRSLPLIALITVTVLGATPKVGERAPQFSLPSSAGSTVSLKDYAGKSKIVLVFYRGYW